MRVLGPFYSGEVLPPILVEQVSHPCRASFSKTWWASLDLDPVRGPREGWALPSLGLWSWAYWARKWACWARQALPHILSSSIHFIFWSLSLFPSRILVYAASFCSSISLFIWRFTFGELFLAKTKRIKSGKIYRHKFMQDQQKPFTNHSEQIWRSIYSSHIDFKISSIVIRVQRNKLRS